LSKVESGAFAAAILALAGLKRLGLQDRATTLLDPAIWLPSPAQGAIGIELRSDDAPTRDALAKLNHEPTAVALACERAFLGALDGSCRTPIAGLATIDGEVLNFRGEVLAPDGSDSVETSFKRKLGADPLGDAGRWGREAGLSLHPRVAQWLDI
jgi:hydroxymethylbilane synthase